jgi:hypothetical protein
MRLLLSQNGHATLLVRVVERISDDEFLFIVLNGAWHGTYDKGKVYVEIEKGMVFEAEILCDDQEKLKGYYQDVLDKWRSND